jgi:TonB-dependent SusC/RagA subfamily outer membrane receptor
MMHYTAFRSVVFAISAASLSSSVGCRRPSVGDRIRADAAVRADSIADERTEKRRSSATQAITFTDAERRQFTRVELMIQSRFSGVQVTPRGRYYNIQIRGASSFGSSNEALVVIDGAVRSLVDLAGVDPKDVDKIEVMKDGAAAFYGSRGANGVIILTTRRAQ